MHDGCFLRSYPTSACTLWAALVVLLFLAVPAAAQDTSAEPEKERDLQVRVGIYFSGSGIVDNISGPWWGNIESSEDDVMPYPGRFLSIRYNNYQATFGWGNDDYEPGHEHYPDFTGHKHNEHIARFTARYNYFPLEKVVYLFGGPVLWYFNKEFTFKTTHCTDPLKPGDPGYYFDPYYTPCKPGAEEPVYFTTDRPDGKSIMFGVNAGFGVEYKLLGLIWSHEIELYFSPCKYKDFICGGGDFKFLGLHLEF